MRETYEGKKNKLKYIPGANNNNINVQIFS